MRLTSAGFPNGASIPKQFTCEGLNISPDLSWKEAPKETKSFAFIMHDPDAPRANGFTHWVVYDIPATVNQIPENVGHEATMPGGGTQGKNDRGKVGYTGPCPPTGEHRYYFRLYALHSMLELGPGASAAEVTAAINSRTIEEAELMGRYQKTGEKAA